MAKEVAIQNETKSPATSKEDRDNCFNVIENNNNLFGEHLVKQIANSDAQAYLGDSEAEFNATANALVTMKISAPRDKIEGMLVAQMIAVNNAAMECFRRSMHPNQTIERCDIHLKHAQKLTKTYTEQVDALEKYRGKHPSKMTIENVNVEAGGQAVVGDVHHSGGSGNNEKK